MSIAGIQGFLASVANNYRNRYLSLARDMATNRTPDHYRSARSSQANPTGYYPTAQVDTYEPSAPVRQTTAKESPDGQALPDKTTTDVSPKDVDAKQSEQKQQRPESPVTKQPDGTYSYERKAELEYKLDLRFDLAAITRTVEQLAEGDTTSVESMAAAGFGLNADFSLDGYQKIRSSTSGEEGTSKRRERTVAGFRNSGAMAYRSQDFAMDSFFNEALKVRRSLDESVHDSHRRATNRFALRYHLDNQFSMGFVERFNAQTKQVADQFPEATEDYVNSAGEVAAKGSTDLMATFFDSVDSYLGDSEDKLLENVSAFFDQAAEDLGFSGTMVDLAKDHLTGTIEQFFDRVETALAGVESQFVTPTPSPAPTAPELYDPSLMQDSRTLATA